MNIESQKFKFKNIKRTYTKSKEVMANRQARKNIPDEIESLDATSKNCNHNWLAGKHDELSFDLSQNNVIITCPECEACEYIDSNALKLKEE